MDFRGHSRFWYDFLSAKTWTLAIFWMDVDRAFIFHIYVLSLWQDLFSGSKILTPWSCSLICFCKTLTLAITFQRLVLGFSYFACVFIVTRLSFVYQHFSPLALGGWFTLKNFNLCHCQLCFYMRAQTHFDVWNKNTAWKLRVLFSNSTLRPWGLFFNNEVRVLLQWCL